MTSMQDDKERDMSFAESAMRMGGKSEEEAKRTGAVDRADDQVELLFAPKYKTSSSPVHRAVWERDVPLELFAAKPASMTAPCLLPMERCLRVVRSHKANGTLLSANNKLSNELIADLAQAGYWGMLIGTQYGGQGASIQHFMSFLTKVATIDPTTAGLASVHGCIGAVDPVSTFGTEEQKQKYLPRLASGEQLSGFALTEPCAGSDLTALRTTAVLDGDYYVVNGEKLFITNAIPGRTVGLVCLIDGKPAALITELPAQENEHFKTVPYKLYALKHAFNNGLIFKDFKVPKENLLRPKSGDGLTVAYHGLNLGRLALCSTAAGAMRMMLANIIPWAHYRKTYGQFIDTRELVKRRIARTAALIVGADALVNWGAGLLDQGYRGELECIIAKIFGSEAQKEVTIEYFMKTHGGRSFLQGHMFGDNVHDLLAPCIYEGEGEMLGMAFFKSLAKVHGVQYFEPIGKVLARENIRDFNPLNPSHAFALRNELIAYAFWRAGKELSGPHRIPPGFPVHDKLRGHVEFALRELSNSPIELSQAMVKHQLRLADRQCRIADMSQRIQDLITMIVTALYAQELKDEVMIDAADILCQDFVCKLNGDRKSDQYFKACSKLADKIIAGGMPGLSNVTPAEIMFSYDQK